ncbi:unnamed protein product [Owenia fusiformis]|uniref:Uncharacterized protein n=1 Tax=Owenia fusiformis TaxID=6347 RepID=A0A8J1UFM1_OWEFU|nr:unnamed protein product [Owenia fusiformis]
MNRSVTLLLFTVIICCTIEHSYTQLGFEPGDFFFNKHDQGFRDKYPGSGTIKHVTNCLYMTVNWFDWGMKESILQNLENCKVAVQSAKAFFTTDQNVVANKILNKLEKLLFRDLNFTITTDVRVVKELEEKKSDFLNIHEELSNTNTDLETFTFLNACLSILNKKLKNNDYNSYQQYFGTCKDLLEDSESSADEELKSMLQYLTEILLQINNLITLASQSVEEGDRIIENLEIKWEELISAVELEGCEADLVECEQDTCENKKCLQPRGARCVMTRCGQCKSRWLRKLKEVECEEVVEVEEEDGSGDV